jgi:2-dehydropantoate 2-reductase
VSTRVGIVGCGAIGALYAAHLAQLPDVEVWAYDVSVDHVAAIDARGLRITGHVDLTAPIRATTIPADMPPCEFGIVATKGTATRPAIEATAEVFAAGSVCSMQNGIGNEEVIAEYVGQVMRGVTLPAGRIVEPGVVHMNASGTTWIGPFEPQPAPLEAVERLAELIDRAGMPTLGLPDARGPQWTKLLFNSCTNPLCALTGLTHGQLCDLAGARELILPLLHEGLAVARALGIELEGDPERLIFEAGRTNYDHKPSMLQDVLARRPTEIGTLNGGIAAQGRAVGVSTPLNDMVVELIRGLERSWRVT